MHLRFFNPYAEVRHTGTTLPHWQQQGAVYFITFRTGDSVPAHLLAQWENEHEAWLKWNRLPHTPQQELEYHRRFAGAIESWLDAGHGECVLRDPILARLVGDVLAYFDGERYAQIAWIVMPNPYSRAGCAASRMAAGEGAAQLEEFQFQGDQRAPES